jgi:hypothetical protein
MSFIEIFGFSLLFTTILLGVAIAVVALVHYMSLLYERLPLLVNIIYILLLLVSVSFCLAFLLWISQ